MNILDYSTTQGTPWHVMGGILAVPLIFLHWSVMLSFVAAVLAYQVYDGIESAECQANTKWDILETAVGVFVAGYIIMIVEVIL
jgi:hypothetical protein